MRDTFFTGLGETEFWIGLNDMETEGIFRLVGESLLLVLALKKAGLYE